MSTRVQENKQRQLDAERIQKKQLKSEKSQLKRQQSDQKFGQFLKKKQPVKQETMMKTQSLETAQQQNAQVLQKSEAQRKNVMLSRQGNMYQSKAMQQASSFHAVLNKNQKKSATLEEKLHQEGELSLGETKMSLAERKQELQNTKESQQANIQELQQKENAEAKKFNAAISGLAEKNSDSDIGDLDQMKGQSEGVSSTDGSKGKAEGVQAHHVEIPQDLIDSLVNEIHVGVDVNGLSMFHVQLKDGVLGGGTMQVKVDGGKVLLQFSGLSKNSQNLLDSSKGKLMRSLEKKGLSLESLSF